jgi:two-component system nitrate/nitrite response regulator NarL
VIEVVMVGAVRLYREGIAHALAQERGGIAVTGTASSAGEAIRAIADLDPNVVLVDLAMPEALDVVRRLAGQSGRRVVVLGCPDGDREILACAEAGIAGLVTRDGSVGDLCEAIESAVRNELACTPYVAGLLLRRVASLVGRQPNGPGWSQLTLREREVAGLLEAGFSNKEIARRLCVELATVKNHVHHILEKLHVGQRSEVAGALRCAEHLVEN